MHNVLSAYAFSVFVSLLTCLTLFHGAAGQAVEAVIFAASVMLIISMLWINPTNISLFSSSATLPFTLLTALYAFWAFTDPDLDGIKHTGLLAISILVYLAVRSQWAVIINGNLAFFAVTLATAAAAFELLIAGGELELHKNNVGAIFSSFLLTNCILIVVKIGFPVIFMTLTGVLMVIGGLFIDHRTSAASGLLVVPAYLGLRIIWKSKWLLRVFGVALGLGSILLVIIVDPDNPLFQQIVPAVKDSYGRRLNSGRETLWPMMISAIREKPWTGWGAGTGVPDYTYLEDLHSAHNQFLQVGYQVGIPGVLLLAWGLWGVWNDITRSRMFHPVLAIGGVGFVLMVIFCSTDAVLNVFISPRIAAIWIPLGIASGMSMAMANELPPDRLT